MPFGMSASGQGANLKKWTVFVCAALLACAIQAQAATVNKVVAVVNGQMISLYDLESAAKPEMLRNGLNPTNPAQRAAVDQLLRRALDTMILDILLAQEAEKQKITVSGTEVDAEITKVMQQSRLPKAEFERQLSREGLTVASLRDRVQKTLLRQKLMGMMVGRKVVVTPEEVAAYYEQHKGQFFSNKVLRMALLVYPDNVDAQAQARKIKSGGTTFEQAVRQVSIGPNREGGGDVGPVPYDKLNPEWKARLAKLNPGEVSDIFNLEGKKAQVKLLQAPKGGEPQDLAAATPEIENILREPKLQERFVEYTEQLRKKAMIDIRM